MCVNQHNKHNPLIQIYNKHITWKLDHQEQYTIIRCYFLKEDLPKFNLSNATSPSVELVCFDKFNLLLSTSRKCTQVYFQVEFRYFGCERENVMLSCWSTVVFYFFSFTPQNLVITNRLLHKITWWEIDLTAMCTREQNHNQNSNEQDARSVTKDNSHTICG